ncbi:Aste57867_23782 [Aphanomyces stellatus]|uniref:Aste57867_23782 protein n=1 Tax=Aphanomyces stellatus TaxID=120398 RepID=A0A485LNK2_9STRA|nr:hypothetical protein As57867_023709 [Aphanomyces stellatus]VFU00427.1 Aste57867_23782 [Aphanomyces stellatus]
MNDQDDALQEIKEKVEALEDVVLKSHRLLTNISIWVQNKQESDHPRRSVPNDQENRLLAQDTRGSSTVCTSSTPLVSPRPREQPHPSEQRRPRDQRRLSRPLTSPDPKRARHTRHRDSDDFESPPRSVHGEDTESDRDEGLAVDTITDAVQHLRFVDSNMYAGDERLCGLDRNLVRKPRSLPSLPCRCVEIKNPSMPSLCSGMYCENVALLLVCPTDCQAAEKCRNQRFDGAKEEAPHELFMTNEVGIGVRATEKLREDRFVMEYTGEVIDKAEFERRYSLGNHSWAPSHYFMALSPNRVIDAREFGNYSRFL